MCRWFAYISPSEPCLLEDVLISPKHSLVKQVHDHYLPKLIHHDPTNITKDHLIAARNVVYNFDGLGVAWYTTSNADFERDNTGESCDGTQREGLRPALYRTIQPPMNDLNFKSICANTETKVCFAHIRAASSTAITLVNNHPFIFGRHTFMHNGVISSFSSIQRQLTRLLSDASFANIAGSTDSEHLAALYMTHLTKGGGKESFEIEYTVDEMENALQKAVKDVVLLQKKLLGPNTTPNSLNLCATDGMKLVAYRFRNHATQDPPSLYYSTKAGTSLNRKYQGDPDGKVQTNLAMLKPASEHGLHIIVASEPSTYVEQDWELVGKNQFVLADVSGVKVGDIETEENWNAHDPSADQ